MHQGLAGLKLTPHRLERTTRCSRLTMNTLWYLDTGPQPEDTVWTMTVGRAKVVGSISTATPSPLRCCPASSSANTASIRAETRWEQKSAHCLIVPANGSPTNHNRSLGPEILTPTP